MGRTLNAIVANAGIMAPPHLEQRHGYELQFLTNHIGHHLLVTRLLEQLSDTGRVVVLSSSAHKNAPPEGIQFDNLSGERGYAPWTAYGQSKLANLLFAKHLAARFLRSGQTANAVHPGIVRTNLQRHLGPAVRAVYSTIGSLFFKTVPQGAATQCYVAVHPSASAISGEYLVDCNIAQPSSKARERALAARLWETTEEIIARLL
jgi:NAD(P)-dependent dehydrogenase (short-subunit alcohol dehydrogenase family)